MIKLPCRLLKIFHQILAAGYLIMTQRMLIMVLLQGLCYVVDITMVFLTFIGIFDFVFHLVELSRVDERGLLLPYRMILEMYCRYSDE